ncbi:MAG: NADH-quinone oxidoreductase subunit NuoE [Gammaproteobacteria bacterium]|nr:NADH-quinone oxidoreductase subunit NuoE [Gammaproteobacteria bacterium]
MIEKVILDQQTVLPSEVLAKIDKHIAKFPPEHKRSAMIGALTVVQHFNKGYLTVALMDAVADYLDMPEIAVYEVASFYSMFETEEVGENSISVCTNVSCMLRGADAILHHIENRLGIQVGQSTEDGKFYLKQEEECLAACCNAPMMQINHEYYENLTPEKVDEILDQFK